MGRMVETGATIEEIAVAGYEKVLKITDDSVGLQAIIAIHNTSLGPALGGTRIFPYPNWDAALTDVKRLSRGMTYKSALADTGLGGGKSVIICSKQHKTKELLTSFAKAVNQLDGLYTCAEDLGCTLEDATLFSEYTPYVVGVAHEKSSGNPAPFTAWGVFRGIQSVCQRLWNTDSVAGKTVAIQGCGSVGQILIDLLFWAGARLIISDIDWEKTLRLAKKYNATPCPVDDILSVECDILSPNALGGIINPQTMSSMRCKAIAGATNNQLLSDNDADELRRRGIIYAPDFVINSGGLINVTQELLPEGYNPQAARDKTDNIYNVLMQIYEIADKNRISTHQAAVSLADYRLKYGVGKRTVQPYYHHFND